MIRIATAPQAAGGEESYALEVLTDLARLVQVDDESADVVALSPVDTGPAAPSLRECIRNSWFIRHEDGQVRIPASVLRLITSVAGAGAEQVARQRDRYGRVPSSANPLVREGLEREPVISLAAVELRRAVVAAAGRRPLRLVRPWPDGREWAVALTHDVDIVDWWPLYSALRGVELLRKAELRRVWLVARSALVALGSDPVLTAVRRVLEIERSYGALGTWFFLCGKPTLATMLRGDLTYDPGGAGARRILDALGSEEHEAALHGSFATYSDPARFAEQKARLEAIAARPVRGVRQHFLRMEPGSTQRAIERSGFRYDATYGFSDRNGFRLGVADTVPAWDASKRTGTALTEVPLIWMDRALSKYQGIEDPETWIEDGLELANSCRILNGLWVGLWHPNIDDALGFPGGTLAFERLVHALSEHQPFAAPLHRIVEFRAARRRLRVSRMAPDGRMELSAPPGVELESGAHD